MSFENWLFLIKSADKSCLKRPSSRKFLYKWISGREMIEEYNLETNILVHRSWKKECQLLTKTNDWDVEIGDFSHLEQEAGEKLLHAENEPIMTKRVTRHNIEWRIKNLSYPLETYNVTVEPDQCEIIVRTTNKKYFKKLKVRELERCQLRPEQESVSTKHQHNTLIITYKKPALVKDMEAAVLEILNDVEVLDSLNFDVDELFQDLN